MKQYRVLERFPMGTIRPEGFIKEQMMRNKEGMGGHLDEIEPEMIKYPYLRTTHVESWSELDQAGWGAEISGNYWTGLVALAYTLRDEALMKKAENWVNQVLANQQEDGYLGTYMDPKYDRFQDYNAWGNSRGMRALLYYYEATGREEVLQAVYRGVLWFAEHWTGDNKTSYAAPTLIEILITCYHYTGDERLLRFAEEFEDYHCKHDIFGTSYEGLQKKLEYNSYHAAGFGLLTKIPAILYTATGNRSYLQATEKRLTDLREKAMHLTGGIAGVNEYVAPVSSVAETEYCTFTFFNDTYAVMSGITGNPLYGDLMEQIFYNGAQGARKKDEKAIAYLSSPNQIYATEDSSISIGDMQIYSPCYHTACCPVNSVLLLPEFVAGMLLHDEEGNIYTNAYGPCSLEVNGVKLTEETMYPFRDTVTFRMECDKEFTLNLKIPQWCRKYEITVNEEAVREAKVNGGYVPLRRAWKKEDVVRIRFAMEIEIHTVDDKDAANKQPLAVTRGPLLYALPLEEVWKVYTKKTNTCLPEGWHWYSVEAGYTDAPGDTHDALGLKKYQTSWNVALDERLQPQDITAEETEPNGYVWENPPVKLHLKGYRAPYLCSPYPTKTFEPFGKYQTVGEEMELELVPYGCTNLRISYFPRADV